MFDSRRDPMEKIELKFSLINPTKPLPRRSIMVKLDEAAVCNITEVALHLNPAPYTEVALQT